MNRIELVVHVLVASVWLSLAVVLGLKVALLGSEEASLNRARGVDRRQQVELAFRHDKLRSQLAYEASVPALEAAVRRLQLPLQPPQRVATR